MRRAAGTAAHGRIDLQMRGCNISNPVAYCSGLKLMEAVQAGRVSHAAASGLCKGLKPLACKLPAIGGRAEARIEATCALLRAAEDLQTS